MNESASAGVRGIESYKKMKKVLILSLFFFLSVLPFRVTGTNSSDVVINEIAWMGTTASANDEWIELYNNTNTEINLDGWGLYEEGGKTLVEPLTGIIGAKTYYLIERTDDNTVPNIEASQSPTGWGGYGLNNNGEHLQFLDNSSNIIDEVDCSGGWFVGIGKPEYKTMERINSLASGNEATNWQTSENPGGTPKSQNSTGVRTKSDTGQISAETLRNSSEPIVGQTETIPIDNSAETKSPQPKNYPNGIVLNELLPSPEGPDETEEWIEIFNKNNFLVDLSGWKISDSFGKTKEYSLPKNSLIPSQGYLVIKRPESGIVLNNQEEKLVLASPDKQIVDSVYYKGAVRSQSFARFSDQWSWTKTLTPGSLNIQSDQENKTQKDSVVKQKEEEKAPLAAKVMAKEIKQGETKEFSPLKVFSLALLIAALSGTAILMLKRLVEDNKLY